MSQTTVLNYGFPLLMVGVAVWFFLIGLLFRRLKTCHPKTYQEMRGFPLFVFHNPVKFTGFILGREYLRLNDPALSKLGDFMQIYLICCCLLFLVFFGLVVFLPN